MGHSITQLICIENDSARSMHAISLSSGLASLLCCSFQLVVRCQGSAAQGILTSGQNYPLVSNLRPGDLYPATGTVRAGALGQKDIPPPHLNKPGGGFIQYVYQLSYITLFCTIFYYMQCLHPMCLLEGGSS